RQDHKSERNERLPTPLKHVNLLHQRGSGTGCKFIALGLAQDASEARRREYEKTIGCDGVDMTRRPDYGSGTASADPVYRTALLHIFGVEGIEKVSSGHEHVSARSCCRGDRFAAGRILPYDR